jgi:hypothetical protein
MGYAQSLQAPGAMLLALEGRAPWEFGASLAALPLLHSAPRGDGHAVIVFPGVAADDTQLDLSRSYRAGDPG